MEKKRNTVVICLQILILVLNCGIIYLLVKPQLSRDLVSEEVSIFKDDVYYRGHDLKNETLFLLEEQPEYLLYFRSDTCPACKEADEIVKAYLDRHFDQAVVLYFAEAENVVSLFEDPAYGIEVTPSLLYFSPDHPPVLAEGVDEIFDMLDGIVKQVMS